VRSVSSFVASVRRTLSLAAPQPRKRFFVRRDRATVARDDIDSGRLISVVAIASREPAEFAVLGIGQRNDRGATRATDDRVGPLRGPNFGREIDGRHPTAARRERSAKRSGQAASTN
jgi:hypothetical protein